MSQLTSYRSVNHIHYRRPPFRRRNRLGFAATAWLVVFGAIVGAAIVLSARAHATPVASPLDICGDLRWGISLGEIETGLVAAGFTPRAAGHLIGMEIVAHCPEQERVAGQVIS